MLTEAMSSAVYSGVPMMDAASFSIFPPPSFGYPEMLPPFIYHHGTTEALESDNEMEENPERNTEEKLIYLILLIAPFYLLDKAAAENFVLWELLKQFMARLGVSPSAILLTVVTVQSLDKQALVSDGALKLDPGYIGSPQYFDQIYNSLIQQLDSSDDVVRIVPRLIRGNLETKTGSQ